MTAYNPLGPSYDPSHSTVDPASVADAIRENVLLATRLPRGREASLVLTKLQEALLWCGEISSMGSPPESGYLARATRVSTAIQEIK